MENCSDGFNVPREHTAKLYIVGINIPNYIFILTGFLAIYQLPVFSSRGTQ
jgi:hypothetical protein